MDGNNTEWRNTDEALYICSLGETKALVRMASDKDNVYVLFDVKDKDISKDDYVTVFFADPEKTNLSGAVRVKASCMGLKNSGPMAGTWKEANVGAAVSASYDGTPSLNVDEDNGYVVEISIPKSSLPVRNGKVLANVALFDIKNGGEDAIVPTTESGTEKWISVTLD